jgi:hypothetical protein
MNSATYTRPADLARAALKRAGFNSRQVTVRDPHGNGIKVTIRDARVRIGAVNAALAAAEIPTITHGCDGQPITVAGYDVTYLDTVLAPLADVLEARILAAPNCITFELAPGIRAHRNDDGHYGEPELHRDGWFKPATIRYGAQKIAAELLDSGIGLDALNAWIAASAAATAANDNSTTTDAWLDRLALD